MSDLKQQLNNFCGMAPSWLNTGIIKNALSYIEALEAKNAELEARVKRMETLYKESEEGAEDIRGVALELIDFELHTEFEERVSTPKPIEAKSGKTKVPDGVSRLRNDATGEVKHISEQDKGAK